MVQQVEGYLKEYGMTSDSRLPALFSKMPSKNGKGMIVLTHVDDMELYASKEDFANLVEFLKSKGLKRKVEGPLDEKEGSIGFLKRNFKSTHEGDVEITMNSKYVEGLVEVLKLAGAYPKGLPCPSDNGTFQSEERRNGSAECGGPPHVPERSWDTVVSSAGKTRRHVCSETAFYEVSSTG